MRFDSPSYPAGSEGSDSELERTIRRLKTFDEIGKALTSSLDLREVLELVTTRISELLRPSHWAIFLQDPSGATLAPELVVTNGRKRPVKNQRFSVEQGIIGWVVKTGQGVFVSQPQRDSRFSKDVDALISPMLSTTAVIPLRCRNKILGAIQYVPANPDDTYDPNEYSMLVGFADYIAIGIENARNFQRVQQLTIMDDLTTLYNARYLTITLDREFLRFERYKEPFSVLFMDVDNLKKLNDTYGHLAGSQLLIEVGTLIQKICRVSDIPIRYGGDEFVVIMPKTDQKASLAVANRLMEQFRQTEFLSKLNLKITTTCSIGLATVPDNAQSRDELLRAADEAMYAVKHGSKNGVRLASDRVTEPQQADQKTDSN